MVGGSAPTRLKGPFLHLAKPTITLDVVLCRFETLGLRVLGLRAPALRVWE